MRVPFDDITASGLQCGVSCTVEVPGEQDDAPCAVSGELLLRRSSPGRILVTGAVRADMTVCCDRCLESFVLHIQEEVSVVCELTGSGDLAAKEKKLDCGDLDTFFVSEPVVGLDEICRDQLLLAAYGKNICADTCKGLCPGCGMNRNRAACVCHLQKNGITFCRSGYT